MTPDDVKEIGAYIGGGVGTLIALAIGLRKKLSQDTGAINLQDYLVRERDAAIARADLATSQRIADVTMIANLTAEKNGLLEHDRMQSEKLMIAKMQIANLKRLVAEQQPGILDQLSSDFSPL